MGEAAAPIKSWDAVKPKHEPHDNPPHDARTLPKPHASSPKSNQDRQKFPLISEAASQIAAMVIIIGNKLYYTGIYRGHWAEKTVKMINRMIKDFVRPIFQI